MADSLDIYKLPRESVDVEAIARQLAGYLQMIAEDAETLSADPTRRDRLIAELYKRPDVQPYHPSHFVAPGGDPDVYLVPANAKIAELTPPRSFEDCVSRMRLAWPAFMVFNRFKITLALLDHRDLERKVQARKRELMDEWRWNVFDVRFPGRLKGPRPAHLGTRPPTPPAPARIPTPPPSSYSAERVCEDEATSFVENPHALIGRQFFHSPPQDQDQCYRGTWEADSYMVKKADRGPGVEHQYQVRVQALGAAPLPMGKEEVRGLLRYSRLSLRAVT